MFVKKIQQIEDYIKRVSINETAHDFKHVDRVRVWALKIAKNEGFKDMKAVEIAALMHDIGLPQSEKRSAHGEIGAEITSRFLKKNNLLTKGKVEEVCNAIKYHNRNREGKGRLLKILRDADMMDLFGAVGLMRAFTSKSSKPEYNPINIKGETWQMKAGDFDKRFDSGIGIGNFIIDQINFQISCYDNLSTETAKRLAKPLIEFMISFINQLTIEIN